MRPDQTEGIDEARRTDMEPIYPLKRYTLMTDNTDESETIELSVDERLAPIFAALGEDPEGWEYEVKRLDGWWTSSGVSWWQSIWFPQQDLRNFRIVPKRRRMIAVEFNKPVQAVPSLNKSIRLEFDSQSHAEYALEAIRKAIESKK